MQDETQLQRELHRDIIAIVQDDLLEALAKHESA